MKSEIGHKTEKQSDRSKCRHTWTQGAPEISPLTGFIVDRLSLAGPGIGPQLLLTCSLEGRQKREATPSPQAEDKF